MSVSNRSSENNFFNSEQTPFPEVINGKIDTSKFLESSKVVVCLVDKFGKVFKPVKYDMAGNIEILSRLCPTRSELLLTLALGQEVKEEAILQDMKFFLDSLDANLQVILKLYLENGLESSKKV
ncbi:hypothetical protein C0J52_03966 [Blattella germanica]|nr:hypothetical protein C0J52_03966 [Blattella germanica]